MRFPGTFVFLLLVSWTIVIRGADDVLQPDDRPPNPGSQPLADDIQDLVYLAPDRPVFIRLKIRVLGEGFRGLRAAYAQRLHHSLDADGDGVLNAAEMRSIPPSDQLLPPRGPQEKLRSFSNNPVDADGDGAVTLRELTDYVRKSTGPPFDFKMAPPLHDGQVDLFDTIDENGDGTLDGREIQSATHAILKYDANVDEIVDQSELSIDGRRHVGGPSVNGELTTLMSELVVIDSETAGAAETLFMRLIERYDRPQTSNGPSGDEAAGDGRLDAGELAVSRDDFKRWDTNNDAVLDVNEGRQFVLNPMPDLILSVPLGGEAHAAKVRSALSSGGEAAETFTAIPGQRGNLQLTLNGDGFDLSLGASPSPSPDLRRMYDKNFDTADGDGNEYLDMTEIRRMGILPALFSAVDRDGDRTVRKNELLEYVELQALLFGSRVVLLLSHEAQSILDLIDEGADYELGLREVSHAPARILTWDVNGDGRVEPNERPANSRLILQNGETTLFHWEQFRSKSRETGERSASGPKWFRNMDRNRDGDVSPREFLGRIETFHCLDTNADGLLTTIEAQNIE